jgi:phage terminase large subunit-like protein
MTGMEKGYVFVSGLDLGVKHDHSGLVTLGCKMGTGRVRLANHRRWRPSPETGKVDLGAVRAAVMEEYKRFGMLWVGYDPFQAELMAQDLQRAKVPMAEWTFTGKHLDRMASDMMSAFRTRVLELYDSPDLIDDIYRLVIKEGRYGLQKLEAISDEQGHADVATAFAIALPLALVIAQYEPQGADYDPAFGNYDGVTV